MISSFRDKYFFLSNFYKAPVIFDGIRYENNALKVADLAVNGKDIIDLLKIKPGPVIGKVLNGLLEAVLDEKVLNDREALLELAKTLS